MEAALTGSVRIQPLSEKEAPMVLALQGDEVSLPDSAPAALKQDGRVAVDITLAPGAFVSSLVGRSAMLRLAIEDTILLRQTVFPSASGKDVKVGPVYLPEGTMTDYIGVVCLQVSLTNDFGVTLTGFTAPCFLRPTDSTDNQRLMGMLKVVQENASLLATPSEKPGPRGKGATAYLELMERVVQAYARHHHYFEKSARFRLQQAVKLTSVARVESVTHRTLEYVATHPEELQPAPGETGIRYQGRFYLPARTIDETQQRSYDIYENRCLVGFLKTVLSAAAAFVSDLRKTGAEEMPKAKGIVSQLQVQLAVYSGLFAVTDVGELSTLPQPSPIFISSAAYRPFYELMQAWFEMQKPTAAELTFYVSVSKSSRLYEYFVLTQVLKAFGREPDTRRIIAWPRAHKQYGETICNEYVFRNEATEVTVFYEPRISAGTVESEYDTGLIRTMMLDIGENGAPLADSDGAYFTPDFVVRVKDASGVRYWVADAKYATLPAAVRNYAADVMLKYLLQTAPRNPTERIEGLTIFCGKDHGVRPLVRSLRNLEEESGRSPKVEAVALFEDMIVGELGLVNNAIKSIVDCF